LQLQVLPDSPGEERAGGAEETDFLVWKGAVGLLGDGEDAVVLAIDVERAHPGTFVAGAGEQLRSLQINLARNVLGAFRREAVTAHGARRLDGPRRHREIHVRVMGNGAHELRIRRCDKEGGELE